MGLVLGSIPRNTEVTGTPSSASITAMASWEGIIIIIIMIIIMIMTWVGKLGTASHSFCSSNRKEEGSRSGRIDIAWECIIITYLNSRWSQIQ